MRLLLLITFLALTTPAYAQHHHHHHSRVIEFPDVPGFVTLETDLHIHTVFSDGDVWPNIRVEEAVRDGLDVIAMTDHLEYQPHKDDIPHPDRNRSFQIASKAADSSLIVVNGSEITRKMPPGHSNAIFLSDANALLADEPLDAFRAAREQGAFIFWNHPMWEAQMPDAVAKLSDLHRQLIGEGLLNGIEVVNEVTYSDEALQIALDNNLTILGTSDIHGLIDWKHNVPEGGHRPITIVLARERTADALKEGLFAGRTVVWFEDVLIGKPENVLPLIEASITATSTGYEEDTELLGVDLTNSSSAKFILRSVGEHNFQGHANILTLEPNSTIKLRVKTLQHLEKADLQFEVLNVVTAPNVHPSVTWTVAVR